MDIQEMREQVILDLQSHGWEIEPCNDGDCLFIAKKGDEVWKIVAIEEE